MGTQAPLIDRSHSAARDLESDRSAQKGRTREAMLAAARAELGADRGVSVESVAAATGRL